MGSLQPDGGSIMAMAALWIGVMVLLCVLVVDVANWFEHRRHLQLQADAGALAAAGEFAIIDPDGCDDAAIEAMARDYGGIDGPNVYNRQIGGTPPERVHFLLNSQTFYNQPSPVDSTVVTAPPCTAKMVDVKLTETDLPWYFQIGQVPFINAQARVEIRAQNRASGALPVGVPDVNPKRARVQFIDESNGSVLGQADLEPAGTANGLAMWDNSAAPASVPIQAGRVGVRVILSGSSQNIACGEPLVECYDAGSSNGIVRIRGWSAEGAAPKARDVRLAPGTCADPYFSSAAASCTLGIEADVDFGGDPATLGAELDAYVGNTKVATLAYDATAGRWASPTTIALAPGAGPVTFDLRWRKTKGCTTGCSGTFAAAHRAFAGSAARSGPIKLAQVWESAALWANTFERCSAVQTSCTHDLVVRIGLEGSLGVASDVSDPLVSLRVVGGSQNQSLDCDPDLAHLRDELVHGCGPSYEINDGVPCPDDGVEPHACVPLQTGTQRNQVAAGMNERILGDAQATTCTSPSNWSSFPDIPRDDPRIVQVFLTPFGSFQGSGNASVPVINFATFYVTGWSGQGQGFKNPCEGQGDDPVPGGEGGYIVGHFIKYVQTLNDGGGGSEPCDFNAFGSCIAVLTE